MMMRNGIFRSSSLLIRISETDCYDGLSDPVSLKESDIRNIKAAFAKQIFKHDPSQTTLTNQEIFCFAMLDLSKRNLWNGTEKP